MCFLKTTNAFNKHLNIIHTPGHTPGSATLFDSRNKVLFTGDHVEGKDAQIKDFVIDNDGHEGDVKQRLASAKALLKFDFDMILPFHYQMIRENAKQALEQFVIKHNSLT